MWREGRLNPALAPHRVLSKYVLSGTAWLGWWRAATLRVGWPAHPRNSPEQISGDPEAERNARARCSGYPKTLRPLRFAWGPPCATRRSLTTATARLQSLAAPSAPSFRSSSNQTHLPLGWRGCVGLWARLNATVQCLLGHGPVV